MENLQKLISYEESFLSELDKKGKSFNTIKNYRTDLHCFNKFLTEKKSIKGLSEFSGTQVQEYQRYIEEKYPSPNSRRRRVQALRIFFDYLVAHELFPDNPIKKIAVSAKVVEKPHPVNFENIQKILQHYRDELKQKKNFEKFLILRNILLVHLIYGAALKVSDLASLRKQHVNKDKNGNYRVLIAHPKRDPYTVILPGSFTGLYDYYKSELESYQDKFQIEFDEILFNANPFKILSGGLSARGIEVIFHDLSKDVKLKVTARDLRQSAIFRWLGASVPETTIKEWMGVTPNYSLKPFKDVAEENPNEHFPELPLESFLC